MLGRGDAEPGIDTASRLIELAREHADQPGIALECQHDRVALRRVFEKNSFS